MIKKILVLILLTSTLSLLAFEYNLKPTKVNANTWCFLGAVAVPSEKNGGFMSNSCFIKTKSSYVVVDSGGTYEFAKQSYAAMSKIEKLPVNIVIATHEHDDHWLGNSYYKEKFKAKLLGPSSINANYHKGDKTRLMRMLPSFITKGTKIIPIDEEIEEETTLIEGGVKIMIIPFGFKAHSSKDIFVFLPKSKIIFSGDTVMNQRITSNRDGSLIGQIKAHEKMDSKDWINLVPGHGHDTSKTAMDESRLYFKLLKERVMKAVEDDIGADTVSSVVTLSEFEDKVMYGVWNKRNVFEAYNELEFYEDE